MNKTNVSLIIYDYDKDFEKLTKFLRLEPTTVQEAAERWIVRRWELASRLPESEDVEKHLDALLKTLKPSTKEIREIAKKYRCVISVGIHYYEFNPEINLTPEMLSSLASLGVKLWLDIYNMWDGETDHNDHETTEI